MQVATRKIRSLKDLWWEYGHPTIVVSDVLKYDAVISDIARSLYESGLYHSANPQKIFKSAYLVLLSGISYLVLPYHFPTDSNKMMTWILKHGAIGFRGYNLHDLDLVRKMPDYWTGIIAQVHLLEDD